MIDKGRDDGMRSKVKDLTKESREESYNQGFRLHGQAVAGNRTAAKMALEFWQEVYEKDPEDAVAQAYYGISMVLAGRESTDLSKFLGDTIKGLIYLNKAIERDPNNPHIRVLLTYLSHSMPEAIFNKHQKPVKDPDQMKGSHGQGDGMLSQDYREILKDVSALYYLGKKVVSELKGLKDMMAGRRS